MAAIRVLRILAQRVDQSLRRENVIAHRREQVVSAVRQRYRVRRLFDETVDDGTLAGLDYAEAAGLFWGHPDRRHRGPRTCLDVLQQHLAGVHPVNVVGPEHQYVLGALIADDVQVLVNGVGGARKPPRPPPHLGRHGRDVTAQQRGKPPRARYVQVKAMALVLSEHHHLREPAIGQVGQSEVDEAVVASEGHSRFGPVQRKRQ